MFKKIFYKYSQKAREEKVKFFFELMKPKRSDILLDAGGGTGKGFRKIWNYFKEVLVIDSDKKSMETISIEFSHVQGKVSDVCDMPLEDRSVDFVFSNAVIEHIDKSRRYLFAKEIRRIARKGFFIITPNFWFPFEPHYLCPFFQYFPESFKKLFKKYFHLGHYGKGSYRRIDLLTRGELKNLFPEANVIGLKITRLIPETLICWYKKNEG